MTDPSGAVANDYRYDGYGNTLSINEFWGNPHRYGGHVGYYTSEAGFGSVLAGQRWYNPALRRWLSRDPISYAGGENLYEYVAQNPVGYVDPEGLTARCPIRRSGCRINKTKWMPYRGVSCVFHCCRIGYVERRIPTPGNPQGECFYNRRGRLTKDACGGTANDYPASDVYQHIVLDRGGVFAKGGPAFLKSLSNLLSLGDED